MDSLSTDSEGRAAPENVPAPEVSTLTTPLAKARGLARAFSSLRHRNYRLYWCGQVISSIGSSMQSIGQAWLVLALTHSAWQLGLVGALQGVPVLLFSIFGGVFADRWPKRRVLLLTQWAEAIQALVLWALIATGSVQLWQVYILALLLGITASLDRPTRQAFVVEMVGRDDLPNAVALSSASFTLARVVGPAIGGVIIYLSNVDTLFLVNAISYLAAIGGLVLIRSDELHAQRRTHTGERQSTWQSLREGVGYVWKTPSVLLVMLVAGLVLLFGSNFNVVLPLFATDVLHVGAAGFGSLSAAIGVGSFLAALWLAWGNRTPTVRGVLLGALVFGVLEAGFAVSRVYVLSLALIAGVGFAEIAFAMLATTLLQAIAPDHLRGRVMSVAILFFDGSLPLGYVFTGWLANRFGAPPGLLMCALLCVLVAGAGWLWRKPAEREMATPVRV